MSALDIQDIRKKYEECESHYSDMYSRADNDVRFALGDQWPEAIKETRKREGRPCLTENRLMPFVNQVINNIRQARPAVRVKPVDDGADVEVAEIIQGIVRNIEMISSAETCYDTAARNSVMAGVGWLRVRTDYADYNTFDQEIYIDRIQNFRSVMLDPNHQRLDGSDAEYGFIYTDIAKEEFERKYPDAQCVNMGDGHVMEGYVRICEYFVKDYEKKTLVEYQVAGQFGVKTGVAYKDELPEESVTILRERETDVCTIRYSK